MEAFCHGLRGIAFTAPRASPATERDVADGRAVGRRLPRRLAKKRATRILRAHTHGERRRQRGDVETLWDNYTWRGMRDRRGVRSVVEASRLAVTLARLVGPNAEATAAQWLIPSHLGTAAELGMGEPGPVWESDVRALAVALVGNQGARKLIEEWNRAVSPWAPAFRFLTRWLPS